jgi:type IX secretion system PorP/SprF family membrane protein
MLKPKIVLCLCLLCNFAAAQDPNFSFFEAAPLQINPALAGKVPHYQVASLYRNRWLGQNGFQTYYAGLDYHFDLINGGLGLVAMSDRTDKWQSNTVEIAYSQSVRLTKKWALAPGLKMGYTQRQVGYQDFIFADALLTGAPTQEKLPSERFGFMTLGAGLVLHSRKVWLGVATHNLNSPKETPNSVSVQPTRLSLHAGLRLTKRVGKKHYDLARPAVLLERQGGSTKIDLGSNFYYSSLFAGLWLRVLPNSLDRKADALTFLAGYQRAGLRLAYSFGWDLTGIRSDFGTHELVLTAFATRDRRKKKGRKWHNRIQCPFSALEGIYD